jgi:hypothetical protein
LNNDDFMNDMEDFEKQIKEGDWCYMPNPSLIEMNFKCNFKHKKCRIQPGYTDGNLCYCWVHSIMIQQDKYT